ncbi:hypothetical protein C2S52_018856 [Perilla frutescens var. hirtella]|nr:hypothetical protein C2S52_018856 [Perilla frutescens var. hirtella]
MVNVRDIRHLNRPPPMYKPPNMFMSVVLHYSGEFVLSPIAKIYVLEDNMFKVLSSDDEVREACVSALGVKNMKSSWLCDRFTGKFVSDRARQVSAFRKEAMEDLRICSCRSWSLSGIPCTHAICALNHQKLNRDDYVHDFLTVETFKKSYAATIRGVNGAVLWGESNYIPPLPPQMIKGKGKQANARRKASDEKVENLAKNKTKLRRKPSIIRCSGCGGEGHNSVTCVMQNISTISGKASCSSSGSRAPTILPPSTEISDELEGPEEPSQTLTQASQSKPPRVPGPSMLQQLHQGKFKGQGPLILESQRKFISLSEIQARKQ